MRGSLLVAVVALTSLVLAAPAQACSGMVDPRQATRVLVVGRITNIELFRSDLQPPKGGSVWYRKLVTMEVVRVYKGAPPSTLHYWDAGVAQYFTTPDGKQAIDWGGGGDCSTVTEDLSGRYVAVALGGEAHELAANSLYGSVVLHGATDPRVADLLARQGFTLPSTSTR